MKFEVQQLKSSQGVLLDGPLSISPNIMEDERGFFFESWNKVNWIECLKSYGQHFEEFVQDNHSKSTVGVLRGLHFQKRPFAQSKLVRCIVGEIFDVAVDIRYNSPTFGAWVGEILSGTNHKQLWIPVGFAHGFLTLSEIAEVQYKVTNHWSKESEGSVNWADEDININWPTENLKTSHYQLTDKDSNAPFLKSIDTSSLF